jgi:hypothetical protein
MHPAEEDMLELPARGVLRVFVPIHNSRVRRGGSRLYPALSWKGRADRMALCGWITSGRALGDLLRPDMPTLSTAAVSIGPSNLGQRQKRQGRNQPLRAG